MNRNVDALIGAGVAGPVAAMALQRAGVAATVVEAYAEPADDVGAFLTLQVNGLDALRAVGAAEAVAGLGFPTPTMRFRSGTGRVLGELSTGAPLADGTVAVTLRRSDLYRALSDEAARRGIAVEHGRRLVDAVPGPGGVCARFADGTSATADILVGADGIRSHARQVIDPTAAPARYVPVLNIGGYAPPRAIGARPGEYEMVFGKRAFFGFTVAPDGAVWWFANPPRRTEPAPGELAAMSSAQWRAWLLDLFADDATPACDIVDSAPGDLVGWATYDVPSVRRWHRDRMVIIGDAARDRTSVRAGRLHGHRGRGRAGPLHARPPRPRNRLRRLRAAAPGARREGCCTHGARSSRSKAAGPVARVLRDAFLPVYLRKAGRNAVTWLHKHHIDWDAPVVVETGTSAPVACS